MRKKINELKSEKNALEIRAHNLESHMIAEKTKGPVFDGESDRLRHDFEVLKYKYTEVKKKLLDFEKGGKRHQYEKNKDIQDYIKQMRQLENENDRLKRMLKDKNLVRRLHVII